MPGTELDVFLTDIARVLKSTSASEIHLVCTTEQNLKYYSGLKNSPYDSASMINPMADRESALPPMSEVVASALRHERRLNESYNTLALANRHYGRGYALGGFLHPRSRYSEETSYSSMLDSYNRYFDQLNELFASNGQVGFRIHERVDGKVVLAEALHKITMA